MAVSAKRAIRFSENSNPPASQFSTLQLVSSFKRKVANEVSEFFFLSKSSDDEKWKERTSLLHARNPVYRNLSLSFRRKQPQSEHDFHHSITSSSFASFMQFDALSSLPYNSSTLPAETPASISIVAPIQQQEWATPSPARGRDMIDLSSPVSSLRRRMQLSPGKMQCQSLKRRETVLEMAYNGLHSFYHQPSSLQSHKVHRSRSFQRNLVCKAKLDQEEVPCTQEDTDFFSDPVSTSRLIPTQRKNLLLRGIPQENRRRRRAKNTYPSREAGRYEEHLLHAAVQSYQPKPRLQKPIMLQNGFIVRLPATSTAAPYKPLDQADGIVSVGMNKIVLNILSRIPNNTNRKVGVGFVGNCLNWSHKDSQFDPEVKKQVDYIASSVYRPYFTFWVTFVQLVCFIFAVSIYGISTVGVSETIVEAEVLTKSLSVEKVSYTEEDNMWIGPRQADLIHLGARFSPCMRKDANVEAALFNDRKRENLSACCVLNDGSGCFQSDESSCSETLASWLKWNGSSESQFRHSGSVCGFDPRFCLNPQSLSPFEWPDEIISWPICKLVSSSLNISNKGLGQQNAKILHMTCPIVGRPCCYGIQGQCIITTREHCTFLRGFFHAELFLCSQVSCLAEVCAMLPFFKPEQPDQFYRLFTSLFIHAGIFQLLISILFQMFIMRDLEKFCGWVRIGIIYVVSGVGGSLASAIFVPYHVEAGPSGSQFGLIGCCFTDIIHNWALLDFPGWALGKLSLITIILFVLGLLPMIDNFAHLFGFVFGFLLSFALLPYVTFGFEDEKKKRIGVVICLVICVCLFDILVVFFYVSPVYSCPGCHYFNCVPFTETFCKSVEMKIRYDLQ